MAKVADSVEVKVMKPGLPKGPKVDTVVVAVRNDATSIQALKWALVEYSRSRHENPLNFLLLHVVSDIPTSKSKSMRVSEASTDMVAIHLRDNVLPFLESMQDLCDVHEVVSSIEVVKDDLCPEAILLSAKRLKADTLVLGGSDNTTTWGTIAHCTAPGKSPANCRVLVIRNGQKWKEVTSTGQIFDFQEFKDEPGPNSAVSSSGMETVGEDVEMSGTRAPSLFSGKLRILSGPRKQGKFLVKQISEERRPMSDAHLAGGSGSPQLSSESGSLVSSFFGSLAISRNSKSKNLSTSSTGTPSPKWGSPFVSPPQSDGGSVKGGKGGAPGKGLAGSEPPPWPFFQARGAPRGRITLYSSTWCSDSLAVKALLRSKGTPYVDINLDIFPERRKEMEMRSHKSSTPQVFFNAEPVGGLASLLAQQQEGELEAVVEDVLDTECPPNAPTAPDPSSPPPSSPEDEHWSLYQKLKGGITLSDKLAGFQLHRGVFSGRTALEWLQRRGQLGGTWKQANEGMKTLMSKCYIYSIPKAPTPMAAFKFPLFDDSPSALYKFLEDSGELTTAAILNYDKATGLYRGKVRRGSELSEVVASLAEAVRQEFVSDDGYWIHFRKLRESAMWTRIWNYLEEVQRAPLPLLTQQERLSLLLNLHNLAVIQLAVSHGSQMDSQVERLKLFSRYNILLGGTILSLTDIQHCLLQSLRRSTESGSTRAREDQSGLPLPPPDAEPLLPFAIIDASRSGPPFRSYRPTTVLKQLRESARDFFTQGGIVWDALGKQVWVSKIVSWNEKEFGRLPKEVLVKISMYLGGDERRELQKLVGDHQSVKLVYMEYDWRLNAWG